MMNNTESNNTTTAASAPEHSSNHVETLVSDNLWAYVGITIIIVGTVGHILSISVMSYSKSMRVQSSTVYLISMSITGIVSLYTGLLRYVMFIGISGWENDLRDTSDGVCKAHMMITYASLQYFAWLQATVAVDRLISVLLPHQYMTRCKWKVGLLVSLIELLLVVLLNIAVAVSVGQSEEGYCVPVSREFFFSIWGYIDLISFSLLPAAIMIVCNSVILYLLYKSKMKTGSSNSVAKSITVMLMSLNVLFLVTTLPVSVVFFLDWGTYGERQYAVIELAWTIFSLLQYAGSACTFFLYCVTGSKFREELIKMFSCCVPKSAPKITTKISQHNGSLHPKNTTHTDYKTLNVSMSLETTSVTSCNV